MTSLRNMIIGAAALAAGGASAMPGPAANSGDAGQARLTVAVYNPAAPATLTRAEFPFGCWYANGWHGPGYYWCGYRPEAYYRPYYGYRSGGYYSYRPARYTYWRSRHRVRHAWRREHRRWRA